MLLARLWAVPWPPPAFWLTHLIKYGAPYLVVDDGSDDVRTSPFMSADTRKKLARQRTILEKMK